MKGKKDRTGSVTLQAELRRLRDRILNGREEIRKHAPCRGEAEQCRPMDACSYSQRDDCPQAVVTRQRVEQAEVEAREVAAATSIRIPRVFWPFLAIGERKRDPRYKLADTQARAAVHGTLGTGVVLVLAGPTGTGKTLAAVEWLWMLRRGVRRCLFRTAVEVATMDSYGPASADLRDVGAVNNLVLDDLGAEFRDASGFWRARLDGILNARFNLGHEGTTVLTTNLRQSDFYEGLEDRAKRRLAQSGIWINVKEQAPGSWEPVPGRKTR